MQAVELIAGSKTYTLQGLGLGGQVMFTGGGISTHSPPLHVPLFEHSDPSMLLLSKHLPKPLEHVLVVHTVVDWTHFFSKPPAQSPAKQTS
jgi:hypothetical protein